MTGTDATADPLALELFAEFGPAARRVLHTFASARQEGEKWETGGRYFQRQNGKTVRIAAPDSGQTGGGGGGGGRAAPVVLPPAGDFHVTGGRPAAVPNLDARPAAGRPGKDLADVRQVRKARPRAEGPDPEAAAAFEANRRLRGITADLRSRDPGAREQAAGQLREHAAGALPGVVSAKPAPEPGAADEVRSAFRAANPPAGPAAKASPLFGAAERHVENFLSGLVGEPNPQAASGRIGAFLNGVLRAGGKFARRAGVALAKFAAWTLGKTAKVGWAVTKGVARAAYRVATSETVRPFAHWAAVTAGVLAFMAAPVAAFHFGLIHWFPAMVAVPPVGIASYIYLRKQQRNPVRPPPMAQG